MNRNPRMPLLRTLVVYLIVCVSAICAHAADRKNPYAFYTPPQDSSVYPRTAGTRVKNVIFLIGDGMGVAQLAIARNTAVGSGGRLHIDRMPVTGLQTTSSRDHLVTDSAASGTALATGFKTCNGVISIGPDGRRFRTILETARDAGLSTGLVVTSTMSHATPAVFASHVPQREAQDAIAVQLIENRVNVLLGGGKEFFLPRSAAGSKRRDSRDLLAEARQAGYAFVENRDGLQKVRGPYVLGLFELSALTTRAPEPSLAEMTAKALDLLGGNPKGFFIMIEGSQIDWACHANDAAGCLRQTLLFDEAVGVALRFAATRVDTLVVVTADHETGGLTLVGGEPEGDKMKLKWSSDYHSATPVPIYAFGPAAENFAGLHDNTELPRLMAKALGLAFPESPEPAPRAAAPTPVRKPAPAKPVVTVERKPAPPVKAAPAAPAPAKKPAPAKAAAPEKKPVTAAPAPARK